MSPAPALVGASITGIICGGLVGWILGRWQHNDAEQRLRVAICATRRAIVKLQHRLHEDHDIRTANVAAFDAALNKVLDEAYLQDIEIQQHACENEVERVARESAELAGLVWSTNQGPRPKGAA